MTDWQKVSNAAERSNKMTKNWPLDLGIWLLDTLGKKSFSGVVKKKNEVESISEWG